ncbi:hypothetical protein Slala03_70300 [Streptomyces lavendulae subsp. lavendulae]|nr:hypothetical protein Slala03_70300 [Streptomyces lavendulae subsp. lavendulae]
MGICGVCGFFAMVGTRSFLPVGLFGGLVLPWRDDVASRRGARMKAAVSGASGPRPELPPGLVLDEEAHARFAGVALHALCPYRLFEDPDTPPSRPPEDPGPVIHEGPGPGGL